MIAPVNPPAAAGVIVGSPNPRIRTGREGEVNMCHTEMVISPNTSVAFATGNLRLLPSAFPWLSGIANSFSKWRWVTLRLIYVPQASTSVSGSFSLGLQYDEPDTDPVNLAQMSMSKGFVTGPSWAGREGGVLLGNHNMRPPPGSIVCTVDTNRFDKLWYPFITTADLATVTAASPSLVNSYQPAICVFAVGGGPAAPVQAGNVYAQYEVELIEPIVTGNNF